MLHDGHGTVAAERAKWNAVLDALHVKHADSRANFVFFDTGRPQPLFAEALRKRGIEIGRQFPPYTNWARITIGLPAENSVVRKRVAELLRTSNS